MKPSNESGSRGLLARLLQVSYLEQGFLAGSLPVVDTETGEQVERRLDHSNGEAQNF